MGQMIWPDIWVTLWKSGHEWTGAPEENSVRGEKAATPSVKVGHCTMAQALKKFGIKDFAKMMTLATIFSRQNYFR